MGSKDLLLKDQRIVVFVNDCFWYRHKDCPRASAYAEAPPFWIARAERIRRLNIDTFKKLTLKGWTVVTTWRCRQEKAETAETCRRHYLLEYVQTIYREITRLIILLIK